MFVDSLNVKVVCYFKCGLVIWMSPACYMGHGCLIIFVRPFTSSHGRSLLNMMISIHTCEAFRRSEMYLLVLDFHDVAVC